LLVRPDILSRYIRRTLLDDSQLWAFRKQFACQLALSGFLGTRVSPSSSILPLPPPHLSDLAQLSLGWGRTVVVRGMRWFLLLFLFWFLSVGFIMNIGDRSLHKLSFCRRSGKIINTEFYPGYNAHQLIEYVFLECVCVYSFGCAFRVGY